MPGEREPLVARIDAAVDGDTDLKPVDRLTLAYIADSDVPPTRDELREAVGIRAARPLRRCREHGLIERETRTTGTDGRDPYAHRLSAEMRAAVESEEHDWNRSALRDRVIREMASIHYGRQLSSVTSKRVATTIPGATTSHVGMVLHALNDDGIVECVSRGSPDRFRLTGVGLFAPFRALSPTGEAVFADGGEDE